ncbi:MAG TPA: hypothetical protein VFS23_21005 [Vicinamibacterales bacterium]|nr:hypothetical protein [Vicinamibacterales bacterium]
MCSYKRVSQHWIGTDTAPAITATINTVRLHNSVKACSLSRLPLSYAPRFVTGAPAHVSRSSQRTSRHRLVAAALLDQKPGGRGKQRVAGVEKERNSVVS